MPLLPFLKNKRKETGVIVQERSPDQPADESEGDGLKAAAQDILSAISNNDSAALAMAIKAAFQICDSEPHVEGEHLESDEE